MKTINRTNKNEKAAVKNYIESKDLTAFCRSMKQMGIVKQSEILEVLKKHYSERFLNRHEVYPSFLAYSIINRDLDKEPLPHGRVFTFIQQMKENKHSGSYKKVLIEGNKHIYWASPVYGHQDYNKHVWRDNTPENRRKMQIINNYLNNGRD